jgi:hypothetical protein
MTLASLEIANGAADIALAISSASVLGFSALDLAA